MLSLLSAVVVTADIPISLYFCTHMVLQQCCHEGAVLTFANSSNSSLRQLHCLGRRFSSNVQQLSQLISPSYVINA